MVATAGATAGGAAVARADRASVVGGVARVVGAALLLLTGWIHLHLYLDGYRTIHLIGPSFLGNAGLALLAALALLLCPARLLGAAALLGGLLELATLGALLLSLTVGLFGFTESTRAPLVGTTIVVESSGAALLLGIGLHRLWRRGREPRAG